MGLVLINFTLTETLFVMPLKLSGPLIIRIPKSSVILEAVIAMVKVKFQHTDVELWQAYQASTCAVERRRLHVLALSSTLAIE